MATSSIPVLKKNLQALLAARQNLALVQISRGVPLPSPAREYIQIGDAEGDESWGAIGGNIRQEDYYIDLTISVTVEGNDASVQQAVEERAHALKDEIDNAVRADVTVGGAVITAAVGGHIKEESFPGATGTSRGMYLTVQLVCMNRI